jgi:spore coat protein U-like protein
VFAAMRVCLVALVTAFPLAASADGCEVDGPGLQFGRINVLTTEVPQAIGHLLIRCDATVSWIRVRLGAGSSGRAQRREMASGEHRLRYNLYQNARRGLIFGDDSPGAPALTVTLSNPGIPLQIPVFAVIEPGQQFGPGAYSDQILVMVDF